MDNENHKKTWNNFTKFVLWGTVAVIAVLVLMAIFLLQGLFMKIASISEDKTLEKRVAITPEIAKKYLSNEFVSFFCDFRQKENAIESSKITDIEKKRLIEFS